MSREKNENYYSLFINVLLVTRFHTNDSRRPMNLSFGAGRPTDWLDHDKNLFCRFRFVRFNLAFLIMRIFLHRTLSMLNAPNKRLPMKFRPEARKRKRKIVERPNEFFALIFFRSLVIIIVGYRVMIRKGNASSGKSFRRTSSISKIFYRVCWLLR